MTNALALFLVWFVLVAPNHAFDLTPATFLRIPVEGLVVVALALVLPSPARRTMAVVVGLLLALLALLKVLDVAFFSAFDRPFNLVTDRGYLGAGVDLVSGTVGRVGAIVTLVAAAVFVVAVLVFLPLSVARISRLAARHRRPSVQAVSGLAVVWGVCAVAGVQVGTGEPVASISSSRLAVDQVRGISTGVQEQQRFEVAATVDRFEAPARRDVLAGLRGKDVLLIFVESYGRTALEGSPDREQVRALLDNGTRRLQAAGYSSRSAFLTSPVFGGLSWLAHATAQSGLWVDNEPRYESLLSSDRLTLTRAFDRAGWRTVAVMPSTDNRWPEGKRFFQFDKVYYKWNFRYQGKGFGFSRMPDQYALSVFQREELARDGRRPLMAQVELSSSHAPWAPIPRMIGWNDLGDGSVIWRIHQNTQQKDEVWSDRDNIEPAFVDAISYSLSSVISFIKKYGDEELVVVLLGDHQPATVVSGHGASHDVPVTVIAHDPSVVDQIAGWGWQPGLRPDPRAPVWRMDAFRDRFLDAFSPLLPPAAARAPAALQP